MANKYYDSAGRTYTQNAIDTKRSKFYKELYLFEPLQTCRGCGGRAQGTAHIIPQKVCKDLGKVELIWSKENTFPACNTCNAVAENPQSVAFHKLRNISTLLNVFKKYDKERYIKATTLDGSEGS